MKILLALILIIFLIPTYTVGGIPVRVEDFAFILIIIFYPALRDLNTHGFFRILILIVLSNLLSFLIQIFKGYPPVLGDLNTIFSLLRNIVIFYAGLKIGQSLNIKFNQLMTILSSGFFISALISLIQFYDVGGLGTATYLYFGREETMLYGINRTVGVAGNPNYAAFYQLCGFIGLLSIRELQNHIYKFLIIFLAGICIWSVYVTFSRTGLVALVFVALGYLVFQKRYTLILGLGIIFIFIAPFLNSLLVGTRYETFISGSGNELLTLNSRVNKIWSRKLEAFYDNPVWGISSLKGNQSDTVFDITIFDNSYIYLLVISGFVGTFLTLLFHYQAIVVFFKNHVGKISLYILLFHINIFVFYLTTDLIKMVMFTSFYFMTVGVLYSYYSSEKSNDDLSPDFYPDS